MQQVLGGRDRHQVAARRRAPSDRGRRRAAAWADALHAAPRRVPQGAAPHARACSMHAHAPCAMHHAPCTMRHAPCATHHALSSSRRGSASLVPPVPRPPPRPCLPAPASRPPPRPTTPVKLSSHNSSLTRPPARPRAHRSASSPRPTPPPCRCCNSHCCRQTPAVPCRPLPDPCQTLARPLPNPAAALGPWRGMLIEAREDARSRGEAPLHWRQVGKAATLVMRTCMCTHVHRWTRRRRW